MVIRNNYKIHTFTYHSLSLSLSLFFLSLSSALGGLFLIRNLFSGIGGISSGQRVDWGCASTFSASLSDGLFLLFFRFFFSFLCFREFFLCFFFLFLDFSSEALSESEDSEEDWESLELSESLEEEEDEDLCLFFSSFLTLKTKESTQSFQANWWGKNLTFSINF